MLDFDIVLLPYPRFAIVISLTILCRQHQAAPNGSNFLLVLTSSIFPHSLRPFVLCNKASISSVLGHALGRPGKACGSSSDIC